MADAFGDAGAEFGGSNYFGMAAIAENKALEFVVDDDFQRQLDAAVAETLLYLLGFMKRFRLDIRCLLSVNSDDDTTRLVSNLSGDTDCVVKEMFGVEIDASPEPMLFVSRVTEWMRSRAKILT